MKISKETVIVGSLALLKLAIHLLTMHNYELQRDAYLYYTLGEHLDWGYVSVPPLIGVISRFSTALFGNTVFALRIFPALAGSLSVIIIARLVKELRGGTMAVLIACLAFVLSPAFLRSNSLFQPVSFNQFSWLLSAYLLVKMVNRRDPRIWIWIMLTWGIAFLNKYSISFFIVASLLSLLVSRHRHLFRSWYFLAGGVLGVLIILPNLLWQHSHNWPLLTHMAELQKYQLVNVTLAGFLADQLSMNFPGLVVWLTGLLVFFFSRKESEFRFLSFTWLFTLLILVLLRGKSYYTLGLYTCLFAMGGVAIEHYFSRRLQYAVIAFNILVIIPILPFSLPLLNHDYLERYTAPVAPVINRWEDGKVHLIPQDFADMTGWRELADIVIGKFESLDPEEKKACMIYAENYGQAGAINFYGRKAGLPSVISFNDNFVLWAPDSIPDAPMIYVNHEIGDVDELYRSVERVGVVNNRFFREDGLQVYYCTGPTAILQNFYAEKVASIRKRYSR